MMKLLRNYLYNMSYQILALITPLITVPYIARVLGPENVGINSYTNSIATYFLLAGTIGITLYGNKEIAYARDDVFKRSKIFWEIECLQLITITIALLAYFAFIFFYKRFEVYFVFQALIIIGGGLDISWYFMGIEDFKTTVLRNMLVKIVSLFGIFLFVRSESSLGIYIILLGLTTVLGNATLWPYLRKSVVRVGFSEMHIGRHLKPTLMLFIPQIAVQIYNQVNKTMLGQFDTLTSVGYYDYTDKLLKIVMVAVTSINTVMLPRMAHLFSQNDYKTIRRYLFNSLDAVSAIAIPAAFGVAGVAQTLAPLYFGRSFAEVGTLLQVESAIIIFIGWSGVIGNQFLMPTNRISSYTTSVTIGAVANIVLNVPLILYFGVIGACVATLISEFIVAAYQFWVIRKYLDFKRLFVNLLKYIIAGITMFIGVYMLDIAMGPTLKNIFVQMIEGALIYSGVLLLLQPDSVLLVAGVLKKAVGNKAKSA